MGWSLSVVRTEPSNGCTFLVTDQFMFAEQGFVFCPSNGPPDDLTTGRKVDDGLWTYTLD